MSITVIQPSVGATATASSVASSFTAPTATGNGVVVVTGSSSFITATSISDAAGNTYTKNVEQGSVGGLVVDGFYCTSATGISSLTGNFSGSGAAFVIAWEVLGTIAPDTHNSNTGNSASQTTGAITTAGADRVVFVADRASSSLTATPSGFTSDYLLNNFAAGYQVYTAVQTGLNPAFAASISVAYSAAVMAFSSSNTGSSPVAPNRRILLPLSLSLGLFKTLPFPTTINVAPPPAAPHADVPPVVYPTPALPLSVRVGLFHQVPTVPLIGVPAPPPPAPPAPPGPGRGKNADLLRRKGTGDDKRRAEEISDKLSAMWNDLTRSGQLRKVNRTYTLVGGSHVDTRDPTATDDVTQGAVVGSLWTNSATATGFMCMANTQGAAVWKQIT